MPQTTLAFMAIYVFSLLILTQQRTSVRAQVGAIKNTIGILANGVATERLERVASLDFDQATRDNNAVFGSAALTATSDFGPVQDKAGDDIDDFHDTAVTFERGFAGDTLRFQAETSVYYVQDANLIASASPTKYKMIDVRVYSLDVALADTIRLSRVKACKSSCQW